jgi:uncharacterized protein
MKPETVAKTISRLEEASMLPDVLSVVWHAGEPLAVPREWYAEAFSAAAEAIPEGVTLEHHFQTNATLIDEKWCDFIRANEIRIGVSIDGPASLHDANRRTRADGPTHAKAMEGVRRLRTAGIDPHVICVLTRAHLETPDALLDFFLQEDFREVAFNIEEIDGVNAHSSLSTAEAPALFASFFSRLVARYKDCKGAIAIREIDRIVQALLDPQFGFYANSPQNRPFAILSVAWDGRFSTFSPELLGTSDARHGSMAFGNIHTDSIAEVAERPTFAVVAREIADGVEKCHEECRYFAFCRGGAPANKLSERGRFDVTDTLYCALTQIVATETVLRALDADLNILPHGHALSPKSDPS